MRDTSDGIRDTGYLKSRIPHRATQAAQRRQLPIALKHLQNIHGNLGAGNRDFKPTKWSECVGAKPEESRECKSRTR